MSSIFKRHLHIEPTTDKGTYYKVMDVTTDKVMDVTTDKVMDVQ